MAEKKEYRNAIRSRMLIRAAFVSLLHEKPFEKITATDVINRADINRSTFYAHYPDIIGIMDEIMDEITEQFQVLLSGHDFSTFFMDPDEILEQVIGFLEENQELYRLLARGKSFKAYEQLEKIKVVLMGKITETPAWRERYENSLTNVISVRLLMNGIIDTYVQWLSGDIVCSLDEITTELTKIISDGMKATR